MDALLIFFLNRSFLDILLEKNQKPGFLFRKSLPFLYLILNGAQNFKFIGSYTWLWLVEFYTLFSIQVKDWASVDIKKKKRSSINLNIHHSKVFSTDFENIAWWVSLTLELDEFNMQATYTWLESKFNKFELRLKFAKNGFNRPPA